VTLKGSELLPDENVLAKAELPCRTWTYLVEVFITYRDEKDDKNIQNLNQRL